MIAGDVLDLDGFTGQRIRHEDRLRSVDRDAVAAVADMVDGEDFSHGAREEEFDVAVAARYR